MRMGTLPSSSLSVFAGLSRPLPPHPQGILPTLLYPLRSEVDASNAGRLSALPGPSHTFTAVDTGKAEPARRRTLLDSLLAPEMLNLRNGAQVMLIRNVDAPRGLVNGTVGLVKGFYSAREVGVRAVGAGPVILNLALVDGVPRRITPGKENVVPSSGKFASLSVKPTSSHKPVKDVSPPLNRKPAVDAKPTVCAEPTADVKPSTAGAKPVRPESDIKPRISTKDEETFPLVEFSTLSGAELVLLLRDEFRVEDAEGNVLARRMQVSSILCILSTFNSKIL